MSEQQTLWLGAVKPCLVMCASVFGYSVFAKVGLWGLSEVSWCFISLLWLPLYDLAVICTGTLTGLSRCSTTVLMMVPELDLAMQYEA